MNVAHFHSGDWYGGVEKLLTDLFDYRLETPEMEPVFILQHKGLLSEKLEERGAVVEMVDPPQSKKVWTKARSFFQLWKIMRRRRCSLIVSHEMDNHAIAWGAERMFFFKSVLWIHSSGFRLRSPVYEKLARMKPDLAICTSSHVREEVRQLWPSLKTDYLYHPYARPPDSGVRPAKRKETTLLYAGRLVEYKGLADVIEALGLISDLDFGLIVVGGAQMEREKIFRDQLIKRAEALGISAKVEFAGFQEDVLDYMRSADVFVHPNKLPEPLGLVFIEALFCELPIVATDIGGAKEILGLQPLKMGDLVPPGDVAALAWVLKKYIENPDYRAGLSKNIREGLVNICDPKVSMKKLASILQSV